MTFDHFLIIVSKTVTKLEFKVISDTRISLMINSGIKFLTKNPKILLYKKVKKSKISYKISKISQLTLIYVCTCLLTFLIS